MAAPHAFAVHGRSHSLVAAEATGVGTALRDSTDVLSVA